MPVSKECHEMANEIAEAVTVVMLRYHTEKTNIGICNVEATSAVIVGLARSLAHLLEIIEQNLATDHSVSREFRRSLRRIVQEAFFELSEKQSGM